MYRVCVFSDLVTMIWAASRQNQQNGICASEDSDQPGHPPSLIRVFATHWAHSEGSDQTRRLHRLIWVFAGRICLLIGFVIWRLNYLLLYASPWKWNLYAWTPIDWFEDLKTDLHLFLYFRHFCLRHSMPKPTKWPVHPAKTHIILVWSVSAVHLMGT